MLLQSWGMHNADQVPDPFAVYRTFAGNRSPRVNMLLFPPVCACSAEDCSIRDRLPLLPHETACNNSGENGPSCVARPDEHVLSRAMMIAGRCTCTEAIEGMPQPRHKKYSKILSSEAVSCSYT